MDVIGKTANGTIRAIFDGDGIVRFVPDDMSSADRYRIWNEWEMGPPDPETGARERINTIPPFVPTPPTPPVLSPKIIAQARLGISEDGNVTGIGGDTGFAGAFPLMDGYIFVQFSNDQGTDQYVVSPTPIGPYLCYVANGDQYSDSFTLTCTDLMGTPATPECIPLLVSKVG